MEFVKTVAYKENVIIACKFLQPIVLYWVYYYICAPVGTFILVWKHEIKSVCKPFLVVK